MFTKKETRFIVSLLAIAILGLIALLVTALAGCAGEENSAWRSDVQLKVESVNPVEDSESAGVRAVVISVDEVNPGGFVEGETYLFVFNYGAGVIVRGAQQGDILSALCESDDMTCVKPRLR